jgi:NAD-dependent SIR2 family protein deacetylase
MPSMDQDVGGQGGSRLYNPLRSTYADDQLLRNYTQNIDTLESQAGVSKVLQCHGTSQLMFHDFS